MHLLDGRQADVKDAQRELAVRKSEFENQRAEFEDYMHKKLADYQNREDALKRLEADTHDHIAKLRRQTEEETSVVLSEANATLEAAKSRREEAEARLAEAHELHQKHASRLSKLVELASGK